MKVRTGTTWHRGKRVWYASVVYNGRKLYERGESELDALGKLEEAINEVSENPVYLLNF